MELQQKASTWEADVDGACIMHTVTTNLGPNEDWATFCRRHAQAVRADLAGDFPAKKEGE